MSEGRGFDFIPSSEHLNVIQALTEVEQGVFFLTGPAGSGKSSLVNYLKNEVFKNVVCAAPTGVAALNVGGQTLHSLFRIPLGPVIPGDSRLFDIRFRKSQLAIFRKCDLLVIDEISMVRADILDAVNVVLQNVMRNSEPFGGKRVLMVGDVFQLEPVTSSAEVGLLSQYYPSPFFFRSMVIEESGLEILELNKIYRQSDRRFISLLNQVKMGEADEYVLEKLNERVTPKTFPEHGIILCARRADAEQINSDCMKALQSSARIYNGKLKGDFATSILPCDLSMELKPGARVMFVRNHAERKYVNGTLGVIENLSDETVKVRLDNDELLEVERETWENVQYDFDEKENKILEKKIGSFEQLPLKPAWAVTIHKSQGLTFDRVHVDLGKGSFAGGQLYVALSRCTTIEGLTLERPLRPADFKVNREIIEFAG